MPAIQAGSLAVAIAFSALSPGAAKAIMPPPRQDNLTVCANSGAFYALLKRKQRTIKVFSKSTGRVVWRARGWNRFAALSDGRYLVLGIQETVGPFESYVPSLPLFRVLESGKPLRILLLGEVAQKSDTHEVEMGLIDWGVALGFTGPHDFSFEIRRTTRVHWDVSTGVITRDSH